MMKLLRGFFSVKLHNTEPMVETSTSIHYTGKVDNSHKATMFEAVNPVTGGAYWTSAEPPHFPIPRYYNSFAVIYNLKKQGKFDEAFKVAWDALQLVPEVAQASAEKYGGKWGVSSIPPLDYVIDYLIMARDVSRLAVVKTLLDNPDELKDFQDMVTFALERIKVLKVILSHIADHPGCLQKTLSSELGVDGRMAAVLISQAEKRGFICRKPFKSTYRLTLEI